MNGDTFEQLLENHTQRGLTIIKAKDDRIAELETEYAKVLGHLEKKVKRNVISIMGWGTPQMKAEKAETIWQHYCVKHEFKIYTNDNGSNTNS